MQVDFTPEQEAFVQAAIRSGRLTRAEDAVRQALLMWEAQERSRLEILSALDEAEADLRSGDFTDYTDETTRELISKLKAEARALRDHGRKTG